MTKATPIYLDNNATTPVDPRVLEAMMPFLTDQFGNAASNSHSFGWTAKDAVDLARRQCAKLIGARPDEIVWTSGATESTNLALKGLFTHAPKGRHRIVTQRSEHKATLDTCSELARMGAEIVTLDVDRGGRIDLDKLAEVLDDKTLACSIMAVNNESGVIQPIEEIGALCKERGVVFHCDAAQAYGKIPLDVKKTGIHLMSVSGHKIYAPKGVGLLYVRGRDPKIVVAEQIHGGGHEQGRRSGTLNVPGVVALGAASAVAGEDLEAEMKQIAGLRDRLHEKLLEAFPDLSINGAEEHRVPGTLNVSLPGIDAQALLMGAPELAISTGSACNSDSVEASYVLRAMNLGDDRALCALRFGVGRFNTEQDIDRAVEMVTTAAKKMRRN